MRTGYKIAWWALIAVAGWISVTGVIYRASHPEKTEWQVLLHMPRSIILDFKE